MNTEDSEFQRIEREQAMRGVPDAIHHTDTSETLEYITGWNDCRQAMLAEQPAQQEPIEWSDYEPDGLHHNKPAQQEPVAWWDAKLGVFDEKHFDQLQPLYTSPPAQRTWVDPNNKTQKQYLPHIGEPVLFCHKDATYMGKHTGGSFQSEATNQYFNTWECHWMYLPADHNIKDNQP